MAFPEIEVDKARAVEIENALNRSDLNRFLSLLSNYALELSFLQKYQGIPCASRALDYLCELGCLALEREYPPPLTIREASDQVVYIATELYWGAGGHTPLLFDLIDADKNPSKELVLTDLHGRLQSGIGAQELTAACSGKINVQCLQANSLLEKTLILKNYLIQKSPKKIVLMTHQFDVVAYCAVTASSATQILWVHHADTFSLGMHIPWYIHIDFNRWAACECAETIGAGVFYWPLVCPDLGAPPRPNSSTKLVTCSHGTNRKFIGEKSGLRYQDILVSRLLARDGLHLHIGDLPEKHESEIRNFLTAHGVDDRRFIAVGRVPSLWEYLKKSEVNLCIASFPVCSPRGLIETKGCGIPILIFEDKEHPSRSSRGHGYENCMTWENTDELIRIIQGFTDEELNRQSGYAREDYQRNHSLLALEQAANIPRSFITPKSRAHSKI